MTDETPRTERLWPMQILARLFHEQRGFGMAQPGVACTTQCEDAAIDAIDALARYGWEVREAAAAPPEPPRLHGVAIRGDYGVTCSCGAVLEWPEGWTRRTDTSAGRVVARHAGYPPSTDWPPPEPPRRMPSRDFIDAMVAALYDDGCLTPPKTDHAEHVMADLIKQGWTLVAAPQGQPLDVERLRDAVEYAFEAAKEWEQDPIHSFMVEPFWPYDKFTDALLARLRESGSPTEPSEAGQASSTPASSTASGPILTVGGESGSPPTYTEVERLDRPGNRANVEAAPPEPPRPDPDVYVGPIQHSPGKGAGACDCWCARCEGVAAPQGQPLDVERLAEAYHRYRLQFPGGTLYCGSESGPFEFDSGPCFCRMDMDGVLQKASLPRLSESGSPGDDR